MNIRKKIKIIDLSLFSLGSYIEQENYKGFDPYDGLESSIFKLPVLKSSKYLRFLSQQLIKRSPINFRPLLFIKKGYNPVTIGLCIQSYSYLYEADTHNKEKYLQKINFLISELEKLKSKGFQGSCWGYDFDWESRFSKINAFQPTVVATGIITNALFVCYEKTKISKAKSLLIDSTGFIINDLNRTYDNDNNICFSYSPNDKQQVLNASMKGARTLSQAFYLTDREEYLELARSAVKFVTNKQNNDGSWIYSRSKSGNWVDNYHTGYVLDCLDDFQKISGDIGIKKNINLGISYYLNNFITESGLPKFFNNETHPIDCTSAGQCILTLVRFDKQNIALKVALKTISEMQKSDGSFKFRKFRYYTISTSFMRWSNAWMYAGLSNLFHKIKLG